MSLCENSELLSIIGILKTVLKIMQIGIPVLLIIFGTIDLGKAVMAGDEKEIKAGYQKFREQKKKSKQLQVF